MDTATWLAVVAVAISIAYSLPHVVNYIRFILRLLSRKELLVGTWHAYHFTRMRGEVVLRYERWEIKRNGSNKLIVRTEDPENPIRYKGVISLERNYLLVILKGEEHQEEVQMRFFDIIPTGQDMAFGLAMGVDFDNRPQCVLRIISRRRLTNQEARQILLSKTIVRDPGIIGIAE